MTDVVGYTTKVQRQSQLQPFTPIKKRFFIGQLTASSTTLYTAPSVPTIANSVGLNPKAIVRLISLCNTDSSARTVTLYLVESGGSVADNRAITKAVSIPANYTWILDNLEIVLEAGDTIRGLADTTLKVTVYIGGEELV
jgi:hypothetical protein